MDLQTDLIGLDATRLVAPLRSIGEAPDLPGLTPRVAFASLQYRVMVPEMAAVPGAALRRPVGACPDLRDALMRAVDILTHGF